jgi:hypothetical protein
MTRSDLTDNVTLYRVRNEAKYMGGVVEEKYDEATEEFVRDGVVTPKLEIVSNAKVSAKTFTSPKWGRTSLDGWHKSAADAWAAWRKAVEANLAEAEQHAKDIRQYLDNGNTAAAVPFEQQLATILRKEAERAIERDDDCGLCGLVHDDGECGFFDPCANMVTVGRLVEGAPMINDDTINDMMKPDDDNNNLPPGWKFITPDDMPPSMRACFLASRKHDQEHMRACPDCLEDEASDTLMDAAWWREEADHDPAPYPDGTRRTPEQCAAELEAEAEQLRLKAAKLRAERGRESAA